MSGLIADGQALTLADYESMVTDKDVARKVLIHTIRDYTPFFDQGVILSANNGDTDKGQIITKYPEGQLRGYNEGWEAEEALGAAARYTASMVRTRSVVDVSLYNTRKPGEREAWRLRKDQVFMRGLARQAVRRVFYGDPKTDARDCLGLANIVVPTSEAFGGRCIDAGGTTNGKLPDIWLANWKPEGMYMFYPQGGEGPGLSVDDMGEQYVQDKNGKAYRALVTEFGWDIGVAAYDPESVVRICNVDTSKLSKKNTTASAPDLIDLMTQALEMLPDDASGRIAFYMNDTIRSVLRRQMQNKDNAFLTWSEIAGRKVLSYGDTPIHKLGNDVIGNDGNVIAFS
nr:MAG TPA: major capsid protein [Caudoviricetes sp.]